MEKSRRKLWRILNIGFILLFISISFYFFSVLSNNNYIGIRAKKIGSDWIIKKVQVGGAASTSNIKQGDQIILIDNQVPQKNPLLNRWLVIEQAENIVVSRDGNLKTVVFSKKNMSIQIFLTFFSLSLIYLIFLIRMPQQWASNKRSKQFYFLGLTIIFSSLAVIPSSIGDFLGRMIIVFFLSSFPVHIFIFLNGLKPKTTAKKWVLFIILCIGILNAILAISSYFIKFPNFIIEYLAIGIFYLLGIILSFLLVDSFQKEKLEDQPRITQINLSLISLLSFLPLFLFYVLPTNWTAPFYLVVIFTILPIFGIIHLLTLTRFIKSRYKMPKSMLYLLLSFLLSVTIFLILLLSAHIPLWLLLIYLFFLIYSLLPLIEEVILTSRRTKNGNDPIALFVATEDERENIATFIHDTVIQDVIYTLKKIEDQEDNTVTTEYVTHELDEIIFNLRELCSDIYPLMIQEMGLKNTIIAMINQTKRKHPVEIFYTIDEKIDYLPPKLNNFILRSLKELINNSILHGKANRIDVKISCDEKKWIIQVLDNGEYIKTTTDSQAHFGLEVIKEKLILLGGKLVLNNDEQTTISLIIPTNSEEELKKE